MMCQRQQQLISEKALVNDEVICKFMNSSMC